jgi:hypothetical protein
LKLLEKILQDKGRGKNFLRWTPIAKEIRARTEE